jgi:hypothetical protein
VLLHLPGDALGDLDVALGQIQAGFPGLTAPACGMDDDVRILQALVAFGPEVDLLGHRPAVGDVQNLAISLVGVDVNEAHIGGDTSGSQSVSNGGTHVARTDDRDFHVNSSTPSSHLPALRRCKKNNCYFGL